MYKKATTLTIGLCILLNCAISHAQSLYHDTYSLKKILTQNPNKDSQELSDEAIRVVIAEIRTGIHYFQYDKLNAKQPGSKTVQKEGKWLTEKGVYEIRPGWNCLLTRLDTGDTVLIRNLNDSLNKVVWHLDHYQPQSLLYSFYSNRDSMGFIVHHQNGIDTVLVQKKNSITPSPSSVQWAIEIKTTHPETISYYSTKEVNRYGGIGQSTTVPPSIIAGGKRNRIATTSNKAIIGQARFGKATLYTGEIAENQLMLNKLGYYYLPGSLAQDTLVIQFPDDTYWKLYVNRGSQLIVQRPQGKVETLTYSPFVGITLTNEAEAMGVSTGQGEASKAIKKLPIKNDLNLRKCRILPRNWNKRPADLPIYIDLREKESQVETSSRLQFEGRENTLVPASFFSSEVLLDTMKYLIPNADPSRHRVYLMRGLDTLKTYKPDMEWKISYDVDNSVVHTWRKEENLEGRRESKNAGASLSDMLAKWTFNVDDKDFNVVHDSVKLIDLLIHDFAVIYRWEKEGWVSLKYEKQISKVNPSLTNQAIANELGAVSVGRSPEETMRSILLGRIINRIESSESQRYELRFIGLGEGNESIPDSLRKLSERGYYYTTNKDSLLPSFTVRINFSEKDSTNRSIRIYTANATKTSISKKIILDYPSMYINKHSELPLLDRASDEIASILGTHSNLKVADLNTSTLWGDISQRYRSNPFLLGSLSPYLAESRFAMVNDTWTQDLRLRIHQNHTRDYAWQNIVYGTGRLYLEKKVSYQDLVETYRRPITTASDRLQVASQRFDSESKQKKQNGLSASTLAAGLSDFIVERAQEELNINFLDRLRNDIMHDTSEFKTLFPNTRNMLTQFEVVQYRSLLDFARAAFVTDLQNLVLNFPKLFELPGYEKEKNDPMVYNIFLIYDIANKVYEGVPLDTVLLHVYTRLDEREENLNEEINLKLARELYNEKTTPRKLNDTTEIGIDTLRMQIESYTNRLDSFDQHVQLKMRQTIDFLSQMENQKKPEQSGISTALGNISYQASRYKAQLFSNIENRYSLLQSLSNTLSVSAKDTFHRKLLIEGKDGDPRVEFQKYQTLISPQLAGNPVYWYALEKLPYAQFDSFFVQKIEKENIIAAGLDLTKQMLSSRQQDIRKSWVELLKDNTQQALILNQKVKAIDANRNNNLFPYRPLFRQFQALQITRLLLEVGLQANIAYMESYKAQAIEIEESDTLKIKHDIQSLHYLMKLLRTPEKYELFDWGQIDAWNHQLDSLEADSIHFLEIQQANPIYITGIINFLENEENMSEEIQRAELFLDSLGSKIQQRIRQIDFKYPPKSELEAEIKKDLQSEFNKYIVQQLNDKIIPFLNFDHLTLKKAIFNQLEIMKTMALNEKNYNPLLDNFLANNSHIPQTPKLVLDTTLLFSDYIVDSKDVTVDSNLSVGDTVISFILIGDRYTNWDKKNELLRFWTGKKEPTDEQLKKIKRGDKTIQDNLIRLPLADLTKKVREKELSQLEKQIADTLEYLDKQIKVAEVKATEIIEGQREQDFVSSVKEIQQLDSLIIRKGNELASYKLRRDTLMTDTDIKAEELKKVSYIIDSLTVKKGEEGENVRHAFEATIESLKVRKKEREKKRKIAVEKGDQKAIIRATDEIKSLNVELETIRKKVADSLRIDKQIGILSKEISTVEKRKKGVQPAIDLLNKEKEKMEGKMETAQGEKEALIHKRNSIREKQKNLVDDRYLQDGLDLQSTIRALKTRKVQVAKQLEKEIEKQKTIFGSPKIEELISLSGSQRIPFFGAIDIKYDSIKVFRRTYYQHTGESPMATDTVWHKDSLSITTHYDTLFTVWDTVHQKRDTLESGATLCRNLYVHDTLLMYRNFSNREKMHNSIPNLDDPFLGLPSRQIYRELLDKIPLVSKASSLDLEINNLFAGKRVKSLQDDSFVADTIRLVGDTILLLPNFGGYSLKRQKDTIWISLDSTFRASKSGKYDLKKDANVLYGNGTYERAVRKKSLLKLTAEDHEPYWSMILPSHKEMTAKQVIKYQLLRGFNDTVQFVSALDTMFWAIRNDRNQSEQLGFSSYIPGESFTNEVKLYNDKLAKWDSLPKSRATLLQEFSSGFKEIRDPFFGLPNSAVFQIFDRLKKSLEDEADKERLSRTLDQRMERQPEELLELTNRLEDLEQESNAIRLKLNKLEEKHVEKLVRVRKHARELRKLTAITLHGLYALRDGSKALDSIAVADTLIKQVMQRIVPINSSPSNAIEISYDSLLVRQKNVPNDVRLNKWISKEQFTHLMEDSLARNIYLGLLYQRLQTLEDGSNFTSEGLALLSSKFINTIYELDEIRENLKNKKLTEKNLSFQDYYPFIRSTVDLLNITLTSPVNGSKTLSDAYPTLRKVPGISDEVLSLFENVFAENYPEAIRNVIQMLSIVWDIGVALDDNNLINKRLKASSTKVLPGYTKDEWNGLTVEKQRQLNKERNKSLRRNQRVRSAILVYGSFMANLVGAKTANEVKGAIKAVAVPPGSSSVKRNSRFNVSLNGYFGAGFHGENIRRTAMTASDWGTTLSLSVPIGVSTTIGGRGRNNNKSYSLFIPVLDVGAVTAFRIDQQNAGQAADLPELTFANLIAPGAYLIFNLPKSPFSIAAGAQYGPQTRKITVNGQDLFPSAWRIGLTTTIDVPIFNFFNK